MPANAAQTNAAANASRRVTPDERRADRARVRSEEHSAAQRRRVDERARRGQVSLLREARAWQASETARLHATSAIEDLETEDERLQDRGASRTLSAIVRGPVVLMAAAAGDAMLLSAVGQSLVSRMYTSDNAAPWTMFVGGLTVLMLELGVGYWAMHEEDQAHPAGQPVARFLSAPGIVRLVLMMGIAATAIATAPLTFLDEAAGFSALNIAMLAGSLLLGLGLHVVILYGARGINDALVYLIHRCALGIHRGREVRAAGWMQRQRNRSVDAWRAYNAAIDDYEATVGAPPPHLRLMAVDGRLVNNAIGETVVRMPAAPGDPEQGGDAGPTAARTRPAAATPAAHEPAPPEHTTEAEGAGVEEYLRRTLEAQQHDIDGQIRA